LTGRGKTTWPITLDSSKGSPGRHIAGGVLRNTAGEWRRDRGGVKFVTSRKTANKEDVYGLSHLTGVRVEKLEIKGGDRARTGDETPEVKKKFKGGRRKSESKSCRGGPQ